MINNLKMMKIIKVTLMVILPFALFVVLFTSPSRADGESPAVQTKSACAAKYEQCQQKCNIEHPDVAPDRIACVTGCSGVFAACDAGVAFEKAKPWIEDQARKTKKFFDDLLGEQSDDTPPPQTKTDENSI